MPSGFPFSSEFHFLFPPFLMIYPQSPSAFGRKKAGTTILVKSSVFASQQTLVIPAALGRYYPVKQKSQQQPALMAQQYY